MQYVSTRGSAPTLDFEGATLAGLASDGGLYVPAEWPTFTPGEIAEEGWRETEAGLAASYGNCMGWSQMLAALKAWVEHGINLREGMYR